MNKVIKEIKNATSEQLIFSWKNLDEKNHGLKLAVEMELHDRDLLDYDQQYTAYLK